MESRSTALNTGVTRPASVAIATEISTSEDRRMASGVQTTLRSGASSCGCAAAVILRSFTEDLAAGCRPLRVATDNTPAWAGPADLLQPKVCLLREPTRQRAGEHPRSTWMRTVGDITSDRDRRRSGHGRHTQLNQQRFDI